MNLVCQELIFKGKKDQQVFPVFFFLSQHVIKYSNISFNYQPLIQLESFLVERILYFPPYQPYK